MHNVKGDTETSGRGRNTKLNGSAMHSNYFSMGSAGICGLVGVVRLDRMGVDGGSSTTSGGVSGVGKWVRARRGSGRDEISLCSVTVSSPSLARVLILAALGLRGSVGRTRRVLYAILLGVVIFSISLRNPAVVNSTIRIRVGAGKSRDIMRTVTNSGDTADGGGTVLHGRLTLEVLFEIDLVLFVAIPATATLQEEYTCDDQADDDEANREESACDSTLVVKEPKFCSVRTSEIHVEWRITHVVF